MKRYTKKDQYQASAWNFAHRQLKKKGVDGYTEEFRAGLFHGSFHGYLKGITSRKQTSKLKGITGG